MAVINDPLLTAEEVAEELRQNKRTIYALMRTGHLPYIDLGFRTKRIRRSVLDQKLKDREAGACS